MAIILSDLICLTYSQPPYAVNQFTFRMGMSVRFQNQTPCYVAAVMAQGRCSDKTARRNSIGGKLG
mgnify:CR=1 FL=1